MMAIAYKKWSYLICISLSDLVEQGRLFLPNKVKALLDLQIRGTAKTGQRSFSVVPLHHHVSSDRSLSSLNRTLDSVVLKYLTLRPATRTKSEVFSTRVLPEKDITMSREG
jgi:hypothetical protein